MERGKRNQRAASAGPERLQKLLARAGYGSRRASEQLIAEGRVTIDGEVVTQAGTQADAAAQDVRVDGNRIRSEPLVYYLVNKPKSVLCTSDDPQRRRRHAAAARARRRLRARGLPPRAAGVLRARPAVAAPFSRI